MSAHDVHGALGGAACGCHRCCCSLVRGSVTVVCARAMRCAAQTPRVPLPPAWEEGWKLQDDRPATRELYDTLVAMIGQINRAVDALPELQPLR